jgi:dTDP-4-dehydrorhamnose 3,5-epimerase
LQVLVPPKFGNAHLVLSAKAVFHYKWSEYFKPHGQFSYRWDDPRFGIRWPIKKPILSERDQLGRYPDKV